jgi:hypothetical protein
MKRIFLLLAFLVVVLTACNSDLGESGVTFLLTDAPGDFVEVNIDIAQVDLKREGEAWQTVLEDVGEYDLLAYQNGKTAVLGEVDLTAGKYEQIRLILNSASVVVEEETGNQTYDLNIPSSQNTGIKLIGLDIAPDTITRVILDFDAAASIHETGKGYQMSPVVRAVADTNAGTVLGSVVKQLEVATEPLAGASIKLRDDSDAIIASASTAEDGAFKVIGLPVGSYTLELSADGFEAYQQTAVVIEAQHETDLGTITLTSISDAP